MNKTEIMEVLNAVRTAGHDFTIAFNRLADVVEELATREESLHATIKDHEATIAKKNSRIQELQSDNAETYQRATKAEQEAWNLMQQNNKLKGDFEREHEKYLRLCDAAEAQIAELSELRPFRSTMEGLRLDVSQRDNEIATLRNEIAMLHEVILTVATSVDKVVNPPAKPQVIEALSYDPGVSHHEGYHHINEARAAE